MASVKVAVRVRPFNQRELGMESQRIIEIEGKKTRIQNIKVADTKQVGEAAREKYRDFTFDYSYWSFDSQDEHFATQEQVFKDLGMDVVGNAFEGYNACVFAYGQTGSGKTHTMMGVPSSPEAQGLIPRICKDMFNRMNQGKEKGTTYRTEVSYLEIYNERVKDLLKKNQTHSLRVREHNKYGIYVEDLSKHLVMDYSDIQDLMERGNTNRTTACTNMNDVSSRSHAIFTMTFVQARFVGDMPSETVSKIHLVDLAGSERADASGATGQRLKEGGHINKSLVTLGSVISALADAAQSKTKQMGHIPYRNSVLTWLLKDSLGGNAKTIMIATISPADVNYAETLSTLRYANRAKNIINKPTINEDSNVKLIRELRAEINKLKSMLGSDIDSSNSVLVELHEKEAKEKVLTEEWTEKWKETQKILMEQKDLALRKAGTGVVLDSQMPHLIGIDDDLLSTGITLYHLKEGETRIGAEEEKCSHDITLRGPGLEPNHCTIILENGVATLLPTEGAICIVNGLQVDKSTRLSQGCVIRLGTNMFRYNDPAEAEKLRREGSRSHLNLSRLSFLSRSSSDLAWSSENINNWNTTNVGEESNLLEEKRKQLEAEEVRLQKESQELLNQKALLEEQKSHYQLLQKEKEEAWKAEQMNKSAAIQSAQKELEDRRLKLEHEYAAHRRRLAEDWKRLEQQEQETLSSLQSKEADLKKRKEYLEWEVEKEMEQIEEAAQRVETLKAGLETKELELKDYSNQLASELKAKLGKPEESFKPVLAMEQSQFQQYLQTQSAAIDEWKANAVNSLMEQKCDLEDKIKEMATKIANCEDQKLKLELEKEQNNLKNSEKQVGDELEKVDRDYVAKKEDFEVSLKLLTEQREKLEAKKKEYQELESEVEAGIAKMVGSEDKITKLESDLALIADQEKLIVKQLAQIDNSKQKLLTIIENSTEETAYDRNDLQLDLDTESKDSDSDIFLTARSTTSTDNMNSTHVWNMTAEEGHKGGSNKDDSKEFSPQRLNRKNEYHNSTFKSDDVSPIRKDGDTFPASRKIISPSSIAKALKLSPEELAAEMKTLVEQINDQKTVVLECLENDCDKEELNNHMAVLQELRNRYLDLECVMDPNGRRRWMFEDDDSFDFDKGEDGTLTAGDSELDDSEAHSSVTDQEDHIQLLVEQRVEKRLREIFEQLKSGQKPNLSLRQDSIRRRSHRRSMPSGLNNAYTSGSDDDASSSSPQALPRSLSMNSVWVSLSQGNGVIPGVLDITIPTYVLRGTGSSTHFQYEICIVTTSERWSILRRYNRFRELYHYMRQKYGSKVTKIPFPPRKLFGRTSENVARERRKQLETFLQTLIRVCSTLPSCPLYNSASRQHFDVRQNLVAFSNFFEKGFFESTKYGTS